MTHLNLVETTRRMPSAAVYVAREAVLMAVELAEADRIELVGTQDQYRETFGFDP